VIFYSSLRDRDTNCNAGGSNEKNAFVVDHNALRNLGGCSSSRRYRASRRELSGTAGNCASAYGQHRSAADRIGESTDRRDTAESDAGHHSKYNPEHNQSKHNESKHGEFQRDDQSRRDAEYDQSEHYESERDDTEHNAKPKSKHNANFAQHQPDPEFQSGQ
jgi:hypothetical protein